MKQYTVECRPLWQINKESSTKEVLEFLDSMNWEEENLYLIEKDLLPDYFYCLNCKEVQVVGPEGIMYAEMQRGGDYEFCCNYEDLDQETLEHILLMCKNWGDSQ